MMNKRALVAGLALLWFPITSIAATLAVLPGATPGAPVLVLSRPFGPSAESLVTTAGGYLIDQGASPFGVVATSPSASFSSRLKASGALMVLDAALLPGFMCGANA
ncbi:MAG: hypothetical protein WBA02_02630 [Jannaschia helgolandensis]|jgi:hypothetical protein|uniref:Uncharacterized protein n=2 Tax=Jannaschia helgolandensis TaxID=188906 RepID=A0A1H7SLZ8_9RHOB|nr:hypothetical protein [Jannaschia helgolandensis]SEL73409.1 hypothetical protein SAMN04488526_3408 [Jannaschia helgolandensis]